MFQFCSVDELLAALGDRADGAEIARIRYLVGRGLPPVTSAQTLGVVIGINSGLVWSFINRPRKHYRAFDIKKGRHTRRILAPRVGLKVIQKWLSYHLSANFDPAHHIFGFIPGRSHIDAALIHSGATWAYSCDVEKFFDSTPVALVEYSLARIGYDQTSASVIGKLCTLDGFLPQGSPASPALSNMCFIDIDTQLINLAGRFNARVTRYADDIVFSGQGEMPAAIVAETHRLFEGTPWRLSPEKESVQPIKGRIKIHGLLIKDDGIRLTKGYRNRLRAYSHLQRTKTGNLRNENELTGHLMYGNYVAHRANRLSDVRFVRSVAPIHKSNIHESEAVSIVDPGTVKAARIDGAHHKTGVASRIAQMWLKLFKT